MLSKFVDAGNKVELQSVNKRKEMTAEQENPIYTTSIYDVQSEDTIELVMPTDKTKLVLLSVGSEYEMIIYGQTGLYQCFARVIDRYKSNNVFIVLMELTSNLRKYQRRQYYRFSCVLEMDSRSLDEQETEAAEHDMNFELQPGLPLKRSVIVDISGGGLRFLSDHRYEMESLIYCSYHLLNHSEKKLYEVFGKVLAVRELDNRPGVFEHRVQYYNMKADVREEIIKFIFEEERKNLQERKN